MPRAEPRPVVVVQPAGRRCPTEVGGTVLAALQAAGVGITAVCGGVGACGACVVQVSRGPSRRPTRTRPRASGRARPPRATGSPARRASPPRARSSWSPSTASARR
ncbi:MAG: 2Fe-2S iron-sulfur cluster binding domain-containing protein [Actinomycetales bacterium]|nr:2Fe-2S iron-sulfur cluster binding domain-containing protein [Actinomycetales bacterium]